MMQLTGERLVEAELLLKTVTSQWWPPQSEPVMATTATLALSVGPRAKAQQEADNKPCLGEPLFQ